MSCEHCSSPDSSAGQKGHFHFNDTKCCWAKAMEMQKFKMNVKHKYIFEPIFDLFVSVCSVGTDIVTLIMYLYKEKYMFAVLTMIPVLLPTLVFTNVYLVDENSKRPVSKVTSISGKSTLRPESSIQEDKNDFKAEDVDGGDIESEGFDSSSTRAINDKENELKQKCNFHFSCFRRPMENLGNCFRGFVQCFCNRDYKLRKRGAYAVRKSFQRMFKYGIGTFVLRIIGCAWYVKAFIYGVKAYREPKKFMKIETPNIHWSYELLVRLEFLQAALENAPQCVIQLYALITQADENKALGILTLAFSFIDFIRVSVYVHWDMDKGPVTAPNGCYDTMLWKMINTSSWILIYAARSAAIAFVFATVGFKRIEALFPIGCLVVHIILFARILSKAEYGVAAQKIFVTVFISVFFLPELSSSVLPAIPQFYYATVIIENAFFILPWDGFGKDYCYTSVGFVERNRTTGTTTWTTSIPSLSTIIGVTGPGQNPGSTTPGFIPKQITAPPTTPQPDEHDCLIDPTLVTLAVPTLTVIGVIFRLASTQKMVSFRKTLPEEDKERDKTQNKLETSIANLFSKKWTQMTIQQLASAFFRMLRKEVLLVDKSPRNSSSGTGGGLKYFGSRKNNKRRISKFHAGFLASQTFIRESFSMVARTTRSHDIEIGRMIEQESPPPDYNSDSELTFRSTGTRKRPRISRSRNVSESLDTTTTPSSPVIVTPQDCTLIPVELPSGMHYLETCWV